MLLLVRSAAYRNFPFGVRCRSEAQMSLSVLRGAWLAPGVPTAPRAMPGTSLLSGGSTEAELASLSSPVLPSSASVVTVPVSSFSRYTKRLSDDRIRWRGPVPCLSCSTGGVFAARSEERRVGKECRSRGSVAHYKRNKEVKGE